MLEPTEVDMNYEGLLGEGVSPNIQLNRDYMRKLYEQRTWQRFTRHKESVLQENFEYKSILLSRIHMHVMK